MTCRTPDPGHMYVAERDCEMCPSTLAQFYHVGRTRRSVCVGCGHDASEYLGRPGKREREREPRTEGVACPACGKVLADEYGLGQHTRAVHATE